VLANRSGAQDHQVILVRQHICDRVEEPCEVLETMRLTRCLRNTSAPVADVWVVTDVAGRPMMGRDIGLDPLQDRRLLYPPHNDALASVDPDERERARCWRVNRLWMHDPTRHDHAHAGRSSFALARSAYCTAAARSQAARSTRTLYRCEPALKLISASSLTA
jgi:hypothetical protein